MLLKGAAKQSTKHRNAKPSHTGVTLDSPAGNSRWFLRSVLVVESSYSCSLAFLRLLIGLIFPRHFLSSLSMGDLSAVPAYRL